MEIGFAADLNHRLRIPRCLWETPPFQSQSEAKLASRNAPRRATQVAAIPWYVWCLAAAVTSDAFGGYWDISWHISIGRDTFWTPAHMMVYLAGVLAGISCGYAILTTTFGSSREMKDSSVSIWGFRGPLGCFIATWGAFAMLTSAPFDNWWHNAYGLDVKIVSLPHSMLALGEAMISSRRDDAGLRAASIAPRARISGNSIGCCSIIGGVEIFGAALFTLESTSMEFMHSARFYRAVASAISDRADRALLRFEIEMAGDHDGGDLHRGLPHAFLWIFPLFPAEPKLGPVYQHITHMVPLWFPTLLIVPAFALDLLRQRDGRAMGQLEIRRRRGKRLPRGVHRGAVAVRGLPDVAARAQSHLRNHLLRILRSGELLYNPYHFAPMDKTQAAFYGGMVVALVTAIIFCSIGMALGNWMRKVQR